MKYVLWDKKSRLLYIIVVFAFIAPTFWWTQKVKQNGTSGSQDVVKTQQGDDQPYLGKPSPATFSPIIHNTNPIIPRIETPTIFNAQVPFTSQAPFAIWNQRDEEGCEEASLIMVAQYFGNLKLNSNNLKLSPKDVDTEMNKIINWEEQNIGEWKSTTIAQTAKIATDYYGLKAEVTKYSLVEIEKSLSGNKLIIIPAAGQKLGNPHYKQPGPLYHMLVIKGYTKNKIITNDPGTKHGANYEYYPEVLENSVHDWNDGDVLNGEKKMIVISK